MKTVNIGLSDEEYRKLRATKETNGYGYLSDSEYLEILLKDRIPKIWEELNQLEQEGKVTISDDMRSQYLMRALFSDD